MRQERIQANADACSDSSVNALSITLQAKQWRERKTVAPLIQPQESQIEQKTTGTIYCN